MDLEFTWNSPGMGLEFTWNSPGMDLEWPGIHLEWTWNSFGMDLEWPGIHLEWTCNSPGMDLERPGIHLEFTWNRAKKISLFFTRIPPGMTWNDLEWQIIWVWIFYLEWGGNLPGFLPNSYHSTWIQAECVGEGKVLHFSLYFCYWLKCTAYWWKVPVSKCHYFKMSSTFTSYSS